MVHHILPIYHGSNGTTVATSAVIAASNPSSTNPLLFTCPLSTCAYSKFRIQPSSVPIDNQPPPTVIIVPVSVIQYASGLDEFRADFVTSIASDQKSKFILPPRKVKATILSSTIPLNHPHLSSQIGNSYQIYVAYHVLVFKS